MNIAATKNARVPALSLLTLSGALLLSLALAGCSSEASAPSAPPAAEVSVAPVLSRSVTQWDDFTGRISAPETVELRPRVSGYIQQVAFDEGQEVRAGDLLFVIDPRPYEAALAQAEASLERARSEARLAQTQSARAKTLIAANVISREEFETRNAASDSTEANVRAAQAAVARARLDLQFTQVRSPISGRAGRALMTAGNMAQADATALTTVVSLDPMYVDFDSDELTFLRFNEQARRATQDAARRPVRVGLASETGYPHQGTLDFIDNQVDPRTGTIRARAVLANPDRLFTPGLFARVQLEGSSATQALLIDDKAVITDQDRKYVYVLAPDGTAARKDVTLGRAIDGLRVVTAGLEPGDQVVIDGVQKVFAAGMPLKAQIVTMEASAPAVTLVAE